MKRTLPIVGALALAVSLHPAGTAQAREKDEISQLASEVRTLRHLTELDLSPKQLDQLHELAVQAAALRADHEKQLEALRPEAIAELEAKKEKILTGETKGSRSRKRDGKTGARYRELKDDLRAKAEPLGDAALALLNVEQKQKVERMFHHARGRRGSDGTSMESILERVRTLDDAEYATVRTRILERHERMMEKRGVGQDTISSQSEKLGAALDESRQLNDTEFAARKSELAASLKPGQSEGADSSATSDRDRRNAGMAAWLSRESTLRAIEELQGR